ncbi:hypothetical protein GCM10023115_28240 [Pontixanthobacter gangjinensis]|uniref:PD-(D/E)XK nuclease family protein n=1 Tax=Christiangramia aestuarii TaxID=1028746 RepID=A0A7K1LMM6_9FLAO|nr:PD-(D/E)XK nuclease family protein [Christiangramia aestuarii]MUP42056.1 hypothetical protein [Christiangramia aestuarii]
MFVKLFSLYNSTAQGRTPLEDFTTEGFAGIIKQNIEILNSFISWLKLPETNYRIYTQVKYPLENDLNCIVDLVLESEITICFIENKVDSKEGWRQIERYAKVLDLIDKPNKYLKYCTKRVDIKSYQYHNFQQFRWYEIANWLSSQFSHVGIVKDYLQFLEKHQMAKDTSITTDTVVSMKKLLQTYEAMVFHVSNAESEFRKIFPNANPKKSRQSEFKMIENSDRVDRFANKILKIKDQDCELLFCIHFETVKLQTQIWININHPQANQLLVRAKSSGFQFWEDEYGIGIFMDCKLYQFIESEDSDQKIKEWFANSFLKFREFINSNPDLNWDKKVLL